MKYLILGFFSMVLAQTGTALIFFGHPIVGLVCCAIAGGMMANTIFAAMYGEYY